MRVTCNVRGRANNTHVPLKNPLLPMFEAVMNSLHALEEADILKTGFIKISLTREPIIGDAEGVTTGQGAVESISIQDNGIGFDPRNMESFKTADSDYKAKRGGKGIGRFTWLKAFGSVEIESVYWDGSSFARIAFEFNDKEEDVPSPLPSIATERLTSVRLMKMLPQYSINFPKNLDTIARRTIEYFLPFFMAEAAPDVSITAGKETIGLKQFFLDAFGKDVTQSQLTVLDHTFLLKGLRIYKSKEKHRLIYAANSREVRFDKLEAWVPNLSNQLDEGDQSFSYLGFLEGDYLDKSVTSDRTAFTFPDELEDGLTGILTLKDIRSAALCVIEGELSPFMEKLNEAKREQAVRFIYDNPVYRPLLSTLHEVLPDIPVNATENRMDGALHKILYEKQRQIKLETDELMTSEKYQALTPADYNEKLSALAGKVSEFGKSSLAQYVLHRRIMLEFLEKSLQYKDKTDDYQLEKVVHSIIYPMQATSNEVEIPDQNLWIIDERLSFHVFLASDKPLNEVMEGTDSKLRPDLIAGRETRIFESAAAFGQEAVNAGSIVIVEFKRPGLAQMGKKNPIDEVQALIKNIQSSKFKNSKGILINATEDTPAYAYVIADLTTPLRALCTERGFTKWPNQEGYFWHNPNLNAYIEVISYQKMLADARQRNKVLFDRLQCNSLAATTS